MTQAFLAGRGFLTIGGADAESFLQNLITTDLASLKEGEAAPGALLTPQGKILFHFLISREGDGFLLETDSASRDNLLKRLTMYRLRAAVDLAAAPFDSVTVSLDGEGRGMVDRRFLKAGHTVRRLPGGTPDAASEAAYLRLRIAHGIAEAPADFALGDAFPHDILMDRDGGLHFRKGCYVGQEVVSRMQHRSTARRRVVSVRAEAPLPPGSTAITAAGKTIGSLGTVCGQDGLAIVRIDKAGEAMAAGAGILAGEVPVALSLPAWTGLSFPTETAGDEA
ncbi:CAF17-like 4Fe-4S cluster assembly/insertion protein YgfZ [Gellertiella hungarica]|uniref:CAF17 C-terminal domain-containing protein n=1 Tax=Gellertiella hungarica TaxID=1572859 RepID=A0A7W6NLH9_9HYPH|nr:folate-binding protein YgfZ [Gellertiella hungarica]MBB4065589.1 hypothetical protein [Gellertiella hungarica]